MRSAHADSKLCHVSHGRQRKRGPSVKVFPISLTGRRNRTNSQPLTFSVLQALVSHPDRELIIDRNPGMTKSEATNLAREYKKSITPVKTVSEKLTSAFSRVDAALNALMPLAGEGSSKAQALAIDKMIEAQEGLKKVSAIPYFQSYMNAWHRIRDFIGAASLAERGVSVRSGDGRTRGAHRRSSS